MPHASRATSRTKKPATQAAKKKASKKKASKKKASKKKASKKKAAKKKASKKKASKKKTSKKKTSKKKTAKKTPAKKPPAKKPPLAVPSDPETLSQVWNEAGRAHFTELSARLEKLYTGTRDVELDLTDPRPKAMGDAVVKQVIADNAAGQWQRARERFDPAYAPVFGWIEGNDDSLPFVAVLGPDEVLVRRGAPWADDGVTLHLHGGSATPVDDVRGFCRSRNRDWLVLARHAGLEIRDARASIAGLAGPPVARIPWPEMSALRPRGLAESTPWTPDDAPLLVEQLGVSDDGMRIVVSCYRQGILLASRHRGERPWTVLWPDARPPYARADDEAPRAGDMTHVAISRDGTRLAFGCQDAGHFMAEIGDDGDPAWYATAGYVSEYPHHAWFSDDGRYTACNACHFYNGATIAFDWEGNRGVSLPEYEVSPQAPLIDGALRVYAMAWLDKAGLEATMHKPLQSPGAFILAGNGILRIATPKGGLAVAQGFGSSAGAIDFCPETRRLALTSYSGFVHLYDVDQDELPGRIDGFRARREITRWALWPAVPGGMIRW